MEYACHPIHSELPAQDQFKEPNTPPIGDEESDQPDSEATQGEPKSKDGVGVIDDSLAGVARTSTYQFTVAQTGQGALRVMAMTPPPRRPKRSKTSMRVPRSLPFAPRKISSEPSSSRDGLRRLAGSVPMEKGARRHRFASRSTVREISS